ncbi:Ribosomal RNA small subunit methyltransferase G [Candidatus Hydrogenisulfobacillus filiaventi]|uniref:Ribosomal RNA small subunit methyltransferase G n=1 Tax=Candidatus Hydrogenisulfobacillus filiaventi TaxID=2707344 RepID=A0A6F8ZK15_9FIRM|nr:16S rRNA (guanine(527)-N(7))-methyltransferase RsmG [Bacillota bacterium]CAB1130274.1 Ribosomal RNA small subunit methyltransferase G [Candidatus Hydrogenisulfobacillus filiaventi]
MTGPQGVVEAWLQAEHGLRLEPQVWEQLTAYVAAVRAAPFNLTAWEETDLWFKGVADSLAGLAVWNGAGPAADIGSGNGQPGLVLAIARPEASWVLVEARTKRAAFLAAVVRELGLAARVEVVPERAEEWLRHRPAGAATVVARALGPLAVTAELTVPAARPGGRILLWRGPEAGREVEAAAAWLARLGARPERLWSYALPAGRGHRVLVALHKVAETPDRYPRRGGALGR